MQEKESFTLSYFWKDASVRVEIEILHLSGSFWCVSSHQLLTQIGANDDLIGGAVAHPLQLCSPSPLHVLTCCSIVRIDVFIFPPSYLSLINTKEHAMFPFGTVPLSTPPHQVPAGIVYRKTTRESKIIQEEHVKCGIKKSINMSDICSFQFLFWEI